MVELIWLSEWFARHRMLIALGVLSLTVAAAFGLTRLEYDNVPRNVFRTSNGNFERLEALFAEFGSDDNDCMLLVEARDGGDLFRPATAAAIRELIDDLRQVDEVRTVRSFADVVVFPRGAMPRSLLPAADAPPTTFDQARQDALDHPLIGGQLLSDDARKALLITRLRGGSLGIEEIQVVVEKLEGIIARHSEREVLGIQLTGVPALRLEIFNSVRRESSRFVVTASILAFGMAWILFHRFWAVLIVAMPPMLGAAWALGSLGLAGEQINVINTVLPTLVMVVGFTDAVHLMVDIRHSRAEGLFPLPAAKRALAHLGMACALTSLTTAIGFGSLAIAEVHVIRHFGLACAAGSVLAFLAVVTVTPLLASTPLGWRIEPPPGGDLVSRNLHLFDAVVDWVIRHHRTVAVGGAILTLLIGATALRLRPDNRLTEYIPRENPSFRALADCDETFGGTLSLLVVVEWNDTYRLDSPELLDAVAEVQARLQADPLVHYPLSLRDVLAALPGTSDDLAAGIPLLSAARLAGQPEELVELSDRFIRPDLNKMLVTARLRDLGTRVYEPVFRALEADLQQIQNRYPGLRLKLTGSVVVASRNITQMIMDLAKSLALAGVFIFMVMSLVFRSLRLGLISVLPNAFPLAVTAAILVITGRPLQLTSVIVFSICLGVAVDDTIHFLTRFQRELAQTGDTAEAIRRSFVKVGMALVITTIVLVAGFGSVLISEQPSSRLFAWLACTAISSALIGDLIILPALLMCFIRSPRQAHVTLEIEPEAELVERSVRS